MKRTEPLVVKLGEGQFSIRLAHVSFQDGSIRATLTAPGIWEEIARGQKALALRRYLEATALRELEDMAEYERRKGPHEPGTGRGGTRA